MQPLQDYSEKVFRAAKDWQTRRRELQRLGSERAIEREAAIAWFLAQGPTGKTLLRRALRGRIPIACGAAVALERMEENVGVRMILRRCQEEEWLTFGVQADYRETILALRWLSEESLSGEFDRALCAAETETDLTKTLALLSLALSALRVLNLRPAVPVAVLERGMMFGHRDLKRLLPTNGVVLAQNITNALRLEAVRGLLSHDADSRLHILLAALQSHDLSVMRSAIGGLRRAGDRRAAPALHTLAFVGGHPLSELAREAYARLVGVHADPLILLRPSQEEIAFEELLRPAADARIPDDTNLLRPHHRE